MNAKTHTASILAVGSELLLGQTVNGNAAWLSKHLAGLGLETKFHLTVADSRPQMREALATCAAQTNLIFVTGGLGPTSDDFTRDVVAEHLGTPLEWNEEAWEWVVERMSSRQLVVRDIQKQQCYFPKGAVILPNDQGTAHGFYFHASDVHYFILPGPPREVSAVWQGSIVELLKRICEGIDQRLTRLWDVIGLGESEVALITEPLLAKAPADVLAATEVGYRVHLPYVEFKLTYRESLARKIAPLIDDVDRVLANHVLDGSGEDIVNAFAQALPADEKFLLVDEVSRGFLLHRVMSGTKGQWPRGLHYASTPDSEFEKKFRYVGKLQALGETSAVARWVTESGLSEETFHYPNSSALMRERAQQYFAELALSFWTKALQNQKRPRS